MNKCSHSECLLDSVSLLSVSTALRRTMLRAHRQAWAWQDEWLDLTMQDIRQMEREIQVQLAKKMAEISNEEDAGIGEENKMRGEDDSKSPSRQAIDLDVIDKDKDDNIKSLSKDITRNKVPSTLSGTKKPSRHSDDQKQQERADSPRRRCSINRSSKPDLNSPSKRT